MQKGLQLLYRFCHEVGKSFAKASQDPACHNLRDFYEGNLLPIQKAAEQLSRARVTGSSSAATTALSLIDEDEEAPIEIGSPPLVQTHDGKIAFLFYQLYNQCGLMIDVLSSKPILKLNPSELILLQELTEIAHLNYHLFHLFTTLKDYLQKDGEKRFKDSALELLNVIMNIIPKQRNPTLTFAKALHNQHNLLLPHFDKTLSHSDFVLVIDLGLILKSFQENAPKVFTALSMQRGIPSDIDRLYGLTTTEESDPEDPDDESTERTPEPETVDQQDKPSNVLLDALSGIFGSKDPADKAKPRTHRRNRSKSETSPREKSEQGLMSRLFRRPSQPEFRQKPEPSSSASEPPSTSDVNSDTERNILIALKQKEQDYQSALEVIESLSLKIDQLETEIILLKDAKSQRKALEKLRQSFYDEQHWLAQHQQQTELKVKALIEAQTLRKQNKRLESDKVKLQWRLSKTASELSSSQEALHQLMDLNRRLSSPEAPRQSASASTASTVSPNPCLRFSTSLDIDALTSEFESVRFEKSAPKPASLTDSKRKLATKKS